ncbi:polyprenyl synthetase family protein [Propionispora hippei]|uniref:Farnesyl diphosphate synthase n=1 Tax=Propionispora hippei DSM 15287 TaxID=1123003 RepID=A0A1M6AZX4_9FIRM|nr:farnesyl diphosphate synthase [Propionispora hippei]SHI41991.1 geranylgeranyl diphosphate synthase, type II [Propionispora hippei DSM 15287]
MLRKYIQEKSTLIDLALEEFIPEYNGYPAKVFEAMRYSLLAGGKRLRPVLLMAAADAVGGQGARYRHVACGLEMIHTYSLIHDDLPSMDNDDYRRGKLTNHKVFGEAIALLAGDGLLTAAFEIMLAQPEVAPAVLLQVVREIASSAGATGMIGGQTVDLLSEGKMINIATLTYMHQAKTGALFKAALRAGAMLANAQTWQVDALTTYAEEFGLTFQITDDILDVTGDQAKIGKPVGSDEKNQKATYVSLYSLAEAQSMAEAAGQQALSALDKFGPEADVLRLMVRYILTREN